MARRPRIELNLKVRVILGFGMLLLYPFSWIETFGLLARGCTETSVGPEDQHTATLRDGSTAHLEGGSYLRACLNNKERIVELRGQARFNVASDASWPFVVRTGNASVRVLGTVFDVHASPGVTRVAVREGTVLLTAGGTMKGPGSSSMMPTERLLRAGERATVDTTGIIRSNPTSLESRAPPPRYPDRIVVQNEPLENLIEQMNLYGCGPIRIADPELADTSVAGVFAVGSCGDLLYSLEHAGVAEVMYEPDGSVTLYKRRSAFNP